MKHESGWALFDLLQDVDVVHMWYATKPEIAEREIAKGKVDLEAVLTRNLAETQA